MSNAALRRLVTIVAVLFTAYGAAALVLALLNWLLPWD